MILWWTEYAIQAVGWTLIGMMIGIIGTWAMIGRKENDR